MFASIRFFGLIGLAILVLVAFNSLVPGVLGLLLLAIWTIIFLMSFTLSLVQYGKSYATARQIGLRYSRRWKFAFFRAYRYVFTGMYDKLVYGEDSMLTELQFLKLRKEDGEIDDDEFMAEKRAIAAAARKSRQK